MAIFRRLAFVALLALAPMAGAAQSVAPAPVGPEAPAVTPPAMSAAESVTTPLPNDAVAAAAAPAGATGLGSDSPALPGPAAGPRLMPEPGIGQPDGSINLQPQQTSIGLDGKWMNDVLLEPMMIGVCIVVFALLGYAIVAFRRRAGRDPAKFSHNTTVEVIWTAVPVLILVVIAVPSFQLLADQYDPPKPDITVKAIGHQWYWEYEYPDQGGFSFDAVMLSDAEAKKAGSPRLLETDNRVVVPAGAVVKLLTTSVDVIHAWAVPSFWVQMDAVPGRINETWFKVDRPGVYYGQCFQLCGVKHGFMPIAVEVLPRPAFDAWVRAKQAENGIDPAALAVAGAPVPSAPVAVRPVVEDAVAGTAPQVAPTATPGPGTKSARGAGTTDTE